MAVAVQISGGLGSRANIVTTRKADPGDTLDGVGPVRLRIQHVKPRHVAATFVRAASEKTMPPHGLPAGHGSGHWRRSGSASRVRHRRVVQKDAHPAVFIFLIAEGVLDLSFRRVGGGGEVVSAHGDCGIATQLNLVVLEDHVRPALAAVDGEACVLVVATWHSRAANKVGHGRVRSGAEGVFSRLGRLEEHIGMAIAVQLTSGQGSRADVVTIREASLRYDLDGVCPLVLRIEHIAQRDVSTAPVKERSEAIKHAAGKVRILRHGESSMRRLHRARLGKYNAKTPMTDACDRSSTGAVLTSRCAMCSMRRTSGQTPSRSYLKLASLMVTTSARLPWPLVSCTAMAIPMCSSSRPRRLNTPSAPLRARPCPTLLAARLCQVATTRTQASPLTAARAGRTWSSRTTRLSCVAIRQSPWALTTSPPPPTLRKLRSSTPLAIRKMKTAACVSFCTTRRCRTRLALPDRRQ